MDAVVACYNRGSARYLREQDWEVEGLLRAVEKEGPAEWAECARALGVVADAPIALDSRCEQLAGLEPGLEPGLSTVEAAELVVLLLVRGETAVYAAVGLTGFAMACVFATFYAVAISVCHICKCILAGAGTALTVAGVRSLRRDGWGVPGAMTLLWWASKLFGAQSNE